MYYTYYNPRGLSDSLLAEDIKGHLSMGKVFILHDYPVVPQDKKVDWSVNSIFEHFGIEGDSDVMVLGEFGVF